MYLPLGRRICPGGCWSHRYLRVTRNVSGPRGVAFLCRGARSGGSRREPNTEDGPTSDKHHRCRATENRGTEISATITNFSRAPIQIRSAVPLRDRFRLRNDVSDTSKKVAEKNGPLICCHSGARRNNATINDHFSCIR